MICAVLALCPIGSKSVSIAIEIRNGGREIIEALRSAGTFRSSNHSQVVMPSLHVHHLSTRLAFFVYSKSSKMSANRKN
jgi:hypothetical protein